MNDFSKYLVWVIPNAKNPENNLDEKVYSLEYDGTQKEHREFLENFVESHNLNHKGRGRGHLDYALTYICRNEFWNKNWRKIFMHAISE